MKITIFRTVLAIATVFLATNLSAQFSLNKVWETDAVLNTPESVLCDAKSKVLYVSNIGDFQKEGTGYISKIGLDGTIIEQKWITGLTATKGLAIYRNLLYTAEQTSVAVIDIEKGEIIERISIEGAQFLNDVTIDKKGVVYVSDSRTGIIHKIEEGKASVYLENLPDVNGLLIDGKNLLILSEGKLKRADANKNIKILAEGIEGGADGIVKINKDEFIVTGWEGIIYVVRANSAKLAILDTREEKINTADLGFNPSTKTIYVPTFSKNTVIAYQLQ